MRRVPDHLPTVTTPTNPDPPAFVDLHSHLVPAVDDGAASVEEAVECLASLFREGVRTLVTTPHLLLPRLPTDAAVGRELDRHQRAFERLLPACEGRDDLPALGLGQEIWAPDAAAIERVTARKDVGLAGTEAVLVEFGFILTSRHTDVVRAAVAAGRTIVVAHPERYAYPHGVEPLALMTEWRELGALLQTNVGSFSGYYGDQQPGSETLAWAMVREGLVDLIATDHHGARRAGVSPGEAFESLRARGEESLAWRAMVEGPAAVVRQGRLSRRGEPPRSLEEDGSCQSPATDSPSDLPYPPHPPHSPDRPIR